MQVHIQNGLPDEDLDRAAQMYWQAFGAKLGKVLAPERKALAFLRRVLRADHAVSAVDAEGRLVGLAGFKTAHGAMVGGGLGDLVAVYGLFGALWRAALLSVLERDLAADVLLMDGIMVHETARGQGVGTRLLDAVKQEARLRGCRSVRLDVIDTNPRARALYEREGFEAGAVAHLGPLSRVFGFRSATSMSFHAP